MNSFKKMISGWGLYPRTESFLSRPEKLKDLQGIEAPYIPRGLGRCYGDAAQLTEGHVVLTERLNRILNFDSEKGILRAESGVSIADLLDVFVTKGWFLPVTPGTKHVTLGGCVAADIHGKNHHVDGSFGDHVLSLELLLPNGSFVRCSYSQEVELFLATIGGMGLTGLITEVTIQMIPIHTAYMSVRHEGANNLDSLFDKLLNPSSEDRYSVAWVDCIAAGKDFGRGIVMNGHHAEIDELTSKQKHPFRIKKQEPRSYPFFFSSLLLSRRSISLFNSLYYQYNTTKKDAFITDYDTYFYPLDVLEGWNKIYGKKGFVQYQFAVPLDKSRDVCKKVLSSLAKKGFNPYLAVLKRFGKAGPGYLSFPFEGCTLAIDIPIRNPNLFPLLDQLDALIIQNGGRVYLAKDARMSASSFRLMYPRLEMWKKVKHKADPYGKVTSDLAKRLQL